MRKRFKLLAVLMMMTIGFTLTGCSTYTSHGNGTMLVEHNDSDDAYFNFSTFDGTKVLKIKASSGDKMKYTGALDKGNVTVYYDNGGGKKELFTIGGGENVENLFVEEVVWIRLLFQIEFDGLVFAICLPSAREGYT